MIQIIRVRARARVKVRIRIRIRISVRLRVWVKNRVRGVLAFVIHKLGANFTPTINLDVNLHRKGEIHL